MDKETFKKCCYSLTEYIINYKKTVGSRDVYPKISPGYLEKLLPAQAPEQPECWEKIMEDVDKAIMPGLTHWQHPHFFAYCALANSYEALCGDMVSGGLGCDGLSWCSSPAITELEIIMLDWVAQMIGLPDCFMSGGEACGLIHTSACETTFMSIFGARNKIIEDIQKEEPTMSPFSIMKRLVAYTSEQAHGSIERAGKFAMVACKLIPCDENRKMRGGAFRKVIEEDIANGKIPFYCAATLGTTNSCAFDRLDELGPICKEFNIWLHVDAAYAGAAFICPEYRHLLNGVEDVMSYVFNPHKWLLINLDFSCAWFRKAKYISDAFFVTSLPIQHKDVDKSLDLRHMQISHSRRFRALKAWFVLRCNGVEKLQSYIRNHVRLAHYFEDLLVKDGRFEIVEKVTLGLVCFRPKGANRLAKALHNAIGTDARIHLVSAEFLNPKVVFLRLAVVNIHANEEDMHFAYNVIKDLLEKLLKAPQTLSTK